MEISRNIYFTTQVVSKVLFFFWKELRLKGFICPAGAAAPWGVKALGVSGGSSSLSHPAPCAPARTLFKASQWME